ncbi:hypothetical protein QBC44DRAFT_373495 [Cladorrhinum sp. PSN332]|nr:hypothetical protein QBC44DRAFT_373495 [Cladorrhinum sp. PSN332]
MRTTTSIVLFVLGILPALGTALPSAPQSCFMNCCVSWCNPICGQGKGGDVQCRRGCMNDCKAACDHCAGKGPDCLKMGDPDEEEDEMVAMVRVDETQ